MKKLVSMVMGLAAAAAFAIPMPEVQVLTFSVTGAETYADGSALEDGECYALVWAKDGEFDGINADGTAKGADEEVLYIGTIDKDSTVAFQIEDGFKTGGAFDIWILDTRVLENGEVKKVGKSGDKVVVTHAAKATAASVAVSGSQAAPTAAPVAGGTVIAGATVNTADIPALKFTSIKVDGDWVVMEAENSVSGVNYVTKNADGDEGAITSGNGGKITLIRPKKADGEIIRGMVK